MWLRFCRPWTGWPKRLRTLGFKGGLKVEAEKQCVQWLLPSWQTFVLHFFVWDPQQQCINAWTRYEPENGVYHKSSQMYKTIPDTKPHFGDGFLQLWIPKVVETLEQKHVLLAVLFFWGACKIFKDCQKLWNMGHPHFQRIWSIIQILPAGFESGTHNVLHHLSKSGAVPGFTSRRCWYFFFGGNWLEPSLSCYWLNPGCLLSLSFLPTRFSCHRTRNLLRM